MRVSVVLRFLDGFNLAYPLMIFDDGPSAPEFCRGGQVLEKWVRGWRMRMVPRQTVSGHDLYIKAPDMKPEVMPAKHLTSKEAIRSFTALVDKLRERLESGASSGADAAAPPVRATCYFTPANGRVALELHVVARPSVGTASSVAEAEAEAEAE